ncbi:pyridoxamine 5'-phosphate oxidase family protein (plasmid) [Ensifer adhaerens]|nr:pyridoxamine 5'-phosphate oxidase family protein [Ensifer adhaerens]UAY05814.1 pyridoxamine 5'-phosphate oxidase family protein [Ensifer adhaerens]UAY13191.1 pyridoxamine 5'-phosphate oxidase family protein [Ensifer adhaerens]
MQLLHCCPRAPIYRTPASNQTRVEERSVPEICRVAGQQTLLARRPRRNLIQPAGFAQDAPTPTASALEIRSSVRCRHDVFAAIHGNLVIDNDRATIERLWNPFVAAWYEGGKGDAKLVLLRLEPEHAEIWKDASSLWAGVKMLFGVDPKDDYKDNVGQVDLS